MIELGGNKNKRMKWIPMYLHYYTCKLKKNAGQTFSKIKAMEVHSQPKESELQLLIYYPQSQNYT